MFRRSTHTVASERNLGFTALKFYCFGAVISLAWLWAASVFDGLEQGISIARASIDDNYRLTRYAEAKATQTADQKTAAQIPAKENEPLEFPKADDWQKQFERIRKNSGAKELTPRQRLEQQAASLYPDPPYPDALKIGYRQLPDGREARAIKQKMLEWERVRSGKKFVNDHYTMKINTDEQNPQIKRLLPADLTGRTWPTIADINWNDLIRGEFQYSEFDRVTKADVEACERRNSALAADNPFKEHCRTVGDYNTDTERELIVYISGWGYCGVQGEFQGRFIDSIGLEKPILSRPKPEARLCGAGYREFMFDAYYAETEEEFAKASYWYKAIKQHNESLPAIEQQYTAAKVNAILKRNNYVSDNLKTSSVGFFSGMKELKQ